MCKACRKVRREVKTVLRFVEKPNLPEGKVCLLLMGEEYRSRLSLESCGISVCGWGRNRKLPAPVASHIDMQALHLYREKFISFPVEKCKGDKLNSVNADAFICKVSELVNEKPVLLRGETELSKEYPKCAAFNALLLGNTAVYNPKCLDFRVKHELENLGYKSVFVRQGYARCSVCVVRENAVITQDEGIAAALKELGTDVLLIQNGYISLPGYDTGFIGGAAFKVSSDVLAFTGKLDLLPDVDAILSFIRNHGVEPLILSSEPIFDIGTAIPVLETV